jgi:hypothetical protein
MARFEHEKQKIEIMQIRHDLFLKACQIRYSISAIYIRYENAQIVTIYHNYSLSEANANGFTIKTGHCYFFTLEKAQLYD